MPQRLCSQPRCGKLLPEGERYLPGCAKCDQRQELDKPWGRKEERLRFYGTVRWQKIRAVKLAEDPVCQGCKHALAEEVDHIVPATADNPRGWFDWDNLQSLCKPCHKDKTAQASIKARSVVENKKNLYTG